ncbi:MAG: YbhB/YbcL family Raf kinase inhibitor-like protein [Spirochaetaceae bacterium]|nr:MAG: YbhB/YbcL family Raf kinase inhibitor-like protein [Spirochaetaceae bacterium]
MALSFSSDGFGNNKTIPVQYTADGTDSSPPLSWAGSPAGTQSFAVICDDPDAPAAPAAPAALGGTWVHWVIWNIPATTPGLRQNMQKTEHPIGPSVQGKNDFGRTGYNGPSPPSGTHRYFFKLYALDAMLSLIAGAKKPQLEAAMKGHVLAQAVLVGTYTRRR